MVGVNYDEAIHKVYSRKKAAIDETSSAVDFFQRHSSGNAFQS